MQSSYVAVMNDIAAIDGPGTLK